ncbi:MAG TPA: hypothetical protein VIJ29_01910 [Candidatus Paceibacterota bacterium]
MDRKWDLWRVLMTCLGGFWLLDGILQLQPAMFTSAFVNTVLAPNLQSQPHIIETLVAFGIRVFSINIFWFNLASALIQLLIGVLLLFPFRRATGRFDTQRFGLWLSIIWAFIVWIFGEGFGLLFTGSATFYTGGPGSALLYLILALFLLYSSSDSGGKRLPLAAGIIFILGGLLNLAPMFWQPTMLSMLAMTPGVSATLSTFGAQGTMIGNLIAIDVLVFIGIFLILAPNRPIAWIAIIFLAVIWAIGQNFGGLQTFPFGTATDPNSAPLLALFLLPIFFTMPPAQTSPQ